LPIATYPVMDKSHLFSRVAAIYTVQGPRKEWAEGALAPPPSPLFGAKKKNRKKLIIIKLENPLVSD